MGLRRIVLLGHNGFVAILIVMTRGTCFSRASLEDLLDTMRDSETLDPYAILNRDRSEELGFDYCQLGAGSC